MDWVLFFLSWVLWFTRMESSSDSSPCSQIRVKIKLSFLRENLFCLPQIIIVRIVSSTWLEQTKELQLSLTRKCSLHLAQIFHTVAQAHFLLFGSQCIFCLLPPSHPKLSHKRAQCLRGPKQPKLMIKIEMLKIVETEADWMIYSNLQEKLLFSPELEIRLVVPKNATLPWC